MRRIGTSVIASPTSDLPDFHLMAASQSEASGSLLYIPVSDQPGLSCDIIRIDRLPAAQVKPDAIFQRWLAGYRQFAGPAAVKGSVVVNTANEFLIYAGFSGHPVIGDHHTVMRYVKGAGHDYSIQFVHKLGALSDKELGERLSFVAGCEVAPELFAAGPPAYTEFADKAHAYSEQIRLLTEDTAQLRGMPMERLGKMLVSASPFHYGELWANFARFYGRTAVSDGRIDEFDTAAQCLRLALITLNDARDGDFLEKLLYDVAENLAELLMLTYGDSRPSSVARAVELYGVVADAWSQANPERALSAEVMGGFAAILTDPDSRKPLDAKFSKRAWAALQHKEQTLLAAEFLSGYVKRMAYIARRKGRHLNNDACLAADLTQLLLERAYLGRSFSFNDFTGHLVQAFQAQLDSQLAFYGVTQEDLDQAAASFNARYRKDGERAPGLVLLRPLATSRRIKMTNRFGQYYAEQLSSVVPATLTLESALHLAFVQRFDTQALGGPMDLFGMSRSTAVGNLTAGTPSWQTAAKLLIESSAAVIALFDDTDALLWEMAEVSRLRAFGKLVFVALPGEGGGAEGFTDVAAQKLRGLGFELPTGVKTPGFFLLNAAGAVARTLPFESLWSGELLEAVLARR